MRTLLTNSNIGEENAYVRLTVRTGIKRRVIAKSLPGVNTNRAEEGHRLR